MAEAGGSGRAGHVAIDDQEGRVVLRAVAEQRADLRGELGADNPTLVTELIDLFLADTPPLLAKLRIAIEAEVIERAVARGR